MEARGTVLKRVPISGPQTETDSRPRFGGPREAHAVFQWYNYAESCVPEGKTPLRINLDETSVCLHLGRV
jgi:hypothetical protein